MSGLLHWVPASAAHRSQLKDFVCTSPPTKVRRGRQRVIEHPRRWELKVQSFLRAGLQPPVRPPIFAFVGEEARGIGAVVVFEELSGPAQVELCWAAVAWRLRHRGGGVADELMRTALDEITARAIAHGVDIVQVSAQIDERNEDAQKLARRHGLAHTGWLGEDSPYQQWTADMLVGGTLDNPG